MAEEALMIHEPPPVSAHSIISAKGLLNDTVTPGARGTYSVHCVCDS